MRGIRLGYRQSGAVIRYEFEDRDGDTVPGEAHLITVAPTRSGKGRDVLVPALLEYEGSCLVIDPKGQLAAITGPERARMGQRVIILNPFKILPGDLGPDGPEHFGRLNEEDKARVTFNAKFNPMAALDPASDSFGVDCDNIADSIVTHEPGATGETHWSDSARGLVAGLIGYLASSPAVPARDRNLSKVREVITSAKMLRDIATDAMEPDVDEFIKQALSRFAETEVANKGEVASIISTAKTQTQFIGNKAISECLKDDPDKKSRFGFRDLKKKPTTVYLVLPTRYLSTCGKWFRLVLAAALDDLLREEKGLPVLALMDEFAQLGRLAVVENAMGLAAGYGLQMWPVLQDLTQLQEHYPKRWETFLSSAEIQMFFAPRENTTAEYVSKLAGEDTVDVASSSSSDSTNSGRGVFDNTSGRSNSTSISQTQRRVYLPQEVRWLGQDKFLMFADRVDEVTEAIRKPYFEIDEFNGKAGLSATRRHALYSPDPYYIGKPKRQNKQAVRVPSFRTL